MHLGDIKKIDFDYVRNGTVSEFCSIRIHSVRILHFMEPTRTAVDLAEKIRFLVDNVVPDLEKIILVIDNLNTHKLGHLYKVFSPKEALQIAKNWRSITN